MLSRVQSNRLTKRFTCHGLFRGSCELSLPNEHGLAAQDYTIAVELHVNDPTRADAW